MKAKEKLMKIKAEGIFTANQTFEQFVSDLCKRYTRIYGEILPSSNYEYIVSKLEEKGILELENDPDEPLEQGPIYL
ncbi:hypothetical protein [Bacillus wiedmannii]|uniref:hypothetical protein n=1 Tax=Bacillus wiedmannii TaxID=1890302 RepID=UPI000BF0957C|nr:hypothetical protein [Bacillus wiedmannii]PEN61589.1 hypothetical protein CN576_21375 [Bacillus wiedmannii]PHA62835.1 hypothetical protein COE75_16480 [Bacillus wiedmannii]